MSDTIGKSVPLLPVDEETESYTFDKLFIFELPQRGGIYSCGVDTAHGLGKEDEDRFCASMTRVAKVGPDVMCRLRSLTSNRFFLRRPYHSLRRWRHGTGRFLAIIAA